MLVSIPSRSLSPSDPGGKADDGNIVSNQFLAAHDWPFGSALSILMMA
jgi:hypothetical protein